jgi:hypothetical protein
MKARQLNITTKEKGKISRRTKRTNQGKRELTKPKKESNLSKHWNLPTELGCFVNIF